MATGRRYVDGRGNYMSNAKETDDEIRMRLIRLHGRHGYGVSMPSLEAFKFAEDLRYERIPSEGYQRRGQPCWDYGIALAIDAMIREAEMRGARRYPESCFCQDREESTEEYDLE
jgi:hypothetical protein